MGTQQNPEFNIRTTFTVGLTDLAGELLLPTSVIEDVTVILAAEGIDGFSVTQKHGYWKGVPEDCLAFEVCSYTGRESPNVFLTAQGLAIKIAEACCQECVLFTVDYITGGLGYAQV